MDTNCSSTNTSQLLHLVSLRSRLQQSRRSLFALLSLLLLFLLAYNGANIFFLQVPFTVEKSPPEPASSFLPENVAGKSRNWQSPSTVLYSLKEENPPPILQKTQNLVLSLNDSVVFSRQKRRKHKLVVTGRDFRSLTHRLAGRDVALKTLLSNYQPNSFSIRVKEFLTSNSCQIRFFMTWISSLESFGERELFAIQSLFKSHQNGCLVIVSNSMDTKRGMDVLKPFSDFGFRVIAISPDFDHLFMHTMAESWFDRLRRGKINPGEVPLGQNLSNLLRLTLLYKFGGVYLDTDVIVLRSFTNLRNSIGAQTIDHGTGSWTRLNNAVMVFDKGHPLLYKFIEEFALTFNGNKWGHNGPYLVSRVVSKMKGRDGFDVNVLNPTAFYPVDWSRVSGLFRGPRNETHSKWLRGKLNQIRSQSYAVHLWNRQSRKIQVEDGSIINQIMEDCCVFCNSSASYL